MPVLGIRLRGSAVAVLLFLCVGWLGWSRQHAAASDAMIAALQSEVGRAQATLAKAEASRQGVARPRADAPPAAAAPVQRPAQGRSSSSDGLLERIPSADAAAVEPAALAHERPVVEPRAVPASVVGTAVEDPGPLAGTAVGDRGECAAHPVVLWHYPKTGGTTLRKHLKAWAQSAGKPLWKKEGCTPMPCAGYTEFFGESWGETPTEWRSTGHFASAGLLISHMRGWGVHELLPRPSEVLCASHSDPPRSDVC